MLLEKLAAAAVCVFVCVCMGEGGWLAWYR